ncbi:MAG: response regulator [Candidatus Obscuribacterales bacterium]|nr:response regulator [Candidatus Obscuribacterales bacterium]
MDPEFLKRLQEAFIEEAGEQIQIIRSCLNVLEDAAADKAPPLESLLRTFHSLKGSSRAVNLKDIESSCQLIENALVKCKGDESNISRPLLDRMHMYVDELHTVIVRLQAEQDPQSAVLLAIVATLANMPSTVATPSSSLEPSTTLEPKVIVTPVEVLDDTATGSFVRLSADDVASGLQRSASMGMIGTTVRLKVNRVEDLVNGAEELVYAKLVSDQRYIDCGDLQSIVNQWIRRWQRLRPEVENEAQRRSNPGVQTTSANAGSLQEFLDLHDSFVGKLAERIVTMEKAVLADRRTVGGLVDTLLEQSRELTMIPFSVLQDLFLKIVRDLARDQSKSITLKIVGGTTEIDRHILDELKEPLLHLLRNSIDHGIELPDERVAEGKPAEATIELQLSTPSSGKVEIIMRDDGQGIDPDRVKRSAVEKGILPIDRVNEVSYQEALSLIFKSSLTTRGTVSEISGRGLGCAIVKDRVEQLGGTVEVFSRLGRETKFRLTVPVRRATMLGIAVSVGGRTFIIPTASIRAAVRARDQDIRIVEGKKAIIFHERLVPVVLLADILSVDSDKPIDDCTILIVGSEDYPIALVVDDIYGEQEVAVKSLPVPLTKVRNVGGATLLQTGDLAVVVDMNDVLTSAILVGTIADLPHRAVPRLETKSRPMKKKILVVEDSITSRVLLKNILESAGYLVSVASDGQDGWEKVTQDFYDLIVTDVEMPRMNGFELTGKIRKESNMKDVPIIVVTSLASLEDRRRGVEVGANAYFVKSNFEKSNLLEMVKRLV